MGGAYNRHNQQVHENETSIDKKCSTKTIIRRSAVCGD